MALVEMRAATAKTMNHSCSRQILRSTSPLHCTNPVFFLYPMTLCPSDDCMSSSAGRFVDDSVLSEWISRHSHIDGMLDLLRVPCLD